MHKENNSVFVKRKEGEVYPNQRFYLKKKMNILDEPWKNAIGSFLKRRREERKRTLADISSGICATSYLSRIENNLLAIDDSYYRFFFEKLNVDYDLLREERRKEILNEFLKFYLLRNSSECEKRMNEALMTEFYANIEYELMALFVNTLTNRFQEAKVQLAQLEEKEKEFTGEELFFFAFCIGLYAYKTNQNHYAKQHLLMLCEQKYTNQYLRFAIVDLALNTFVRTGDIDMFFKYYHEIESNSNFTTTFPDAAMLHKAQESYFCYSYHIQETPAILKEIAKDIKQPFKKDILWLYYLSLWRTSPKEQLLKELISEENNAFEIGLGAACCFYINDSNLVLQFKSKVENFKFSEYEVAYEKFSVAVITGIKGGEDRFAHSCLGEVLSQQHYVYSDQFFYRNGLSIFIELGLRIHKYQPSLKLIHQLESQNQYISYLL